MRRHEDWAMRLDSYIEKKSTSPFRRGSHDCALFACNCLKEMTGTDIAKDFRRKYTSRKKAYEMVRARGHDSLVSLARERVGNEYSTPTKAKRGDMVAVPCPEGEALAIVDLSGEYAVTTGKDGLEYHPMDKWITGFAV